MVNWAGYALAAERPTSADAGRVGVALAPRHDDGRPTVVVNAFWALAVAAGCANPDQAWEVVLRCLSSEGDVTTTLAGSSGTRLDTWSDPRVTVLSDAFGLFEAAHRWSQPLPVIVELPLLVQILSDLIERVVWQGCDAEVELSRAVEAAIQVLRED